MTHSWFAPKGLRLKAQGCRIGYPGNSKEESSQPQGGCAGAGLHGGRNRDAVVSGLASFPG